MDKSTQYKCKVSVYVSPGQARLTERRVQEWPKTIFVLTEFDAKRLMTKIQYELGGAADPDGGIDYTVVIVDIGTSETCSFYGQPQLGAIHYAESVRVQQHIYAEDLLHIIRETIGAEKSSSKIYGFEPLPKRGGVVTNELVNQIRDELGF